MRADEGFSCRATIVPPVQRPGARRRIVSPVARSSSSPLVVPELEDALNFREVPSLAADALHGTGVFETLRGIAGLVLKRRSAGSVPAPAASAAGGR
mgnify:CR=1 FL=1